MLLIGGVTVERLNEIQQAIDYIESNILEEIDYSSVAGKAFSSSFYFQRTFSILTGMTVGNYIRNRRLTLAGIDLLMSQAKVIDVSLKYGYETPESFAKAFARFHGISPSKAREKGARLKIFSRMKIKTTINGGDTLEYRIEKKHAFNIIAKTKDFSSNQSTNNNQIAQLWETSLSNGTIDALCNLEPENYNYSIGNGIIGIYDAETEKSKNNINFSIGIETSEINAPTGFSIITVPSNDWVVLERIGVMPDSFHKIWKTIYNEFFEQSDYLLLKDMYIEFYPQGDRNRADYMREIWFPVTKR